MPISCHFRDFKKPDSCKQRCYSKQALSLPLSHWTLRRFSLLDAGYMPVSLQVAYFRCRITPLYLVLSHELFPYRRHYFV